MSAFEGSFLGQKERIEADTALECGVCWWIYDPQQGDDVWQIPPGTAFTELPEHWRCPGCDAAPSQFMVLDGAGAAGRATARDEALEPELTDTRRKLQLAYQRVAQRMRDLPVYRAGLPLGVLGPQRCAAGLLAIVYTPWCMNLVLIAGESERLVEGSERDVSFPSGVYPFTRGYLEGLGPLESCSLFSPMEAFADAEAVTAVAAEIMAALFAGADAAGDDSETVADPSRRRLFLGAAPAAAGSGAP